jgi:hypothetical protein
VGSIFFFIAQFFDQWAYGWRFAGHWAYRHWALGILGVALGILGLCKN